MDDNYLLIFTWSGYVYGVPGKNVSGIIGNSRLAVSPATLPAQPAAGVAGRSGRSTILLDIDGIQLAVLADQVVKLAAPAELADRPAITAALRLHQFTPPG